MGGRVLLNPSENLTVAFPGGEFRLQRLGGDSGEADEVLVQGTVVLVFALGPRQQSPALVEHPWKQCVAA